MTVQCLYQNDPKDAAAVLGQRNACRRAANKLGWLIQQERICDASEGTPLLLRPDVQELLRDVEQGRFQVLVVASAEVLQCPEGEWESLLAVLQKGRVRTFAAQKVAHVFGTFGEQVNIFVHTVDKPLSCLGNGHSQPFRIVFLVLFIRILEQYNTIRRVFQ